MSGAIAYIQRHDLGDQLAGARLVGHRLEAAITLDQQASESGPAVQAAQLADWIQRRLAESSHGSRIRTLVLDPEGGLCGWVRPQGLSNHGAGELLRRSGGGLLLGHRDDLEGEQEQSSFHPGVDTPGAGSVQLLMPPAGRKSAAAPADERIAAVAQRDACVRLLLDELDARGIKPHATLSLWHALARAYDPSQRAAADDGVIADDATRLTAIVLAEPHGRVSWAWSAGGELLACGQSRTALVSGSPLLDAHLAGRLNADWLTWSAQLAAVPARLICVLPDGADASGFAQTLAAAWPDVATDAFAVADPLGDALGRLDEQAQLSASLVGDPRQTLVDATTRPTRAHRAMAWWLAAILAGVAIVAGFFAYGLHAAAGQARAGIDGLRAAQLEAYRLHAAAPASGSRAVMNLEQLRVRLEREMVAPESTEAKPVLRAIDDLMLVLPSVAGGEVTLRSLLVNDLALTMTVTVPDTAGYDELRTIVSSVEGFGSWNYTPAARGESLEVTASATWALTQEGS